MAGGFKRAFARKRPVKGTMNQTERRYSELLEARRLCGEIVGFRYEAYTLRLADNTTYTPDFVVQLPSGEIQLHECKVRDRSGKRLIRDDAAVKIKVAAEQYPEFQFCLCTNTPKTNQWDYDWLR